MNQQNALCCADNSLLIVVDIQSRLTAAMSITEVQQMFTHVGRLLESSEILNIPVLLTEQYPKGLGPTDCSILDKLPRQTEKFDKTGFSCCSAEGFDTVLQQNNKQQIILVGMETHVCVLQTAVDLMQQGFQVFVVADAVCSRNNEHKHNALQRMQSLGITVTNHESVIFEWLRTSSHADFKAISRLLV